VLGREAPDTFPGKQAGKQVDSYSGKPWK